MIVVRDYNQDPKMPRVKMLLQTLSLDEQQISILSDGSLLENKQEEQIMLITPLSIDWLDYHRRFVEAHREKTTSWLVVVTGDNPVAEQKMKWFFEGKGLSLHCFRLLERATEELALALSAIKPLRTKSLLLYSYHEACGKKTLKGLLEQYMPGWTIETAEGDPDDAVNDTLARSDAVVKVLVSSKFEMLHYGKRNENVHPFFVLTMPDKQVALYLQSKMAPEANGITDEEHRWAQSDLDALASWAGTTTEKAEKRLFFVSPLYESWRLAGTDPRNDPRFVIWDDFGLPIPRDEYGDASDPRIVAGFLAQFTQAEALATAILEEQKV